MTNLFGKESVLRALHLFPTFSSAAEIDAVRCAHDPLASKIRPHITLVFPFESLLSAEELAAHATDAAASIGCFRVSLGQAQTRGDYIWLPVMQGREEAIALHDALYRGLLGNYLDSTRPYEPHLTIARTQGRDFEKAHHSALALRGPFETYIDRFTIELIRSDESSSVERVLKLRTQGPNQAPEPTAQAAVAYL